MRSTAAVIIFGYRNGKLHVCVVWISSLSIEVFIYPAALRPMSTAELVIAQAIDHYNGNPHPMWHGKKYWFSGDVGYCCSTMGSTAAVIIGYRNGKLHVCVVWISSLQLQVFICPAALRPMSTAELVIAQAMDHFDGNTSSHVKREEVIDSAAI